MTCLRGGDFFVAAMRHMAADYEIIARGKTQRILYFEGLTQSLGLTPYSCQSALHERLLLKTTGSDEIPKVFHSKGLNLAIKNAVCEAT